MFLPRQQTLRESNLGTSFLLLSWKEMFDPYTPDTFQPRLYDLPALVRELHDLAVMAKTDNRWLVHQKAVQEEIHASLDDDRSFVEKMPYFAWACDQLAKLQEISAIERLCKSLDGYRSIYEAEISRELEACATGLPEAKAAGLKALRRTATIALNRGYGEQEAESLCDEDAFKLNPLDWVQRLQKQVDVPANAIVERDCIIPVFGSKHKTLKKVLEPSGKFQVVTRSSLPFEPKDDLHKAVFVKLVGLRGGTETETARLAVRSLRPVLDVFGFYERIHVTLADAAWVGRGQYGKFVNTTGECLRKLPPRKHSSIHLTREALKVPAGLLNHRIVNSLEHYTLAQTNSAFRIKLVNLWSAVECLCPKEAPGSVFDRVCRTVTPIVVWRRIDKITRYLASTLTRFRQSGHTSGLGPGFCPDGFVSAEEVLLALCRPYGHRHIVDLLAGTASHPLLTNRIFLLWKRFSNPNDLFKDMQVSRQRTDWHLLRIYRARNLIVHEGREITTTPYLVDNLQYYLSVTLSRILHGMSSHPGWEVEDSANHWQNRSAYVLDKLKTGPAVLKVKDFYPVTVRCVHDHPWPPAPASPSPSVSPPPPVLPSSSDAPSAPGSATVNSP